MRPSLANLGIRKGLWPLVQRTERALRAHQAAAALRISMGLGTADSDAESEDEAAQQETEAPSKPPPIDVGSSDSGWGFMAVLRRSGAVLLEAGAWLWRTQAALSTLLPRLELRMLRWAFSKVLSPRTAPRLLGSSSFRAGGGSGSKAAGSPCVGSWPLQSLYEDGPRYVPRAAGFAAGLRQLLFAQRSPPLRRLGSYPIMLEDHQLSRLGSFATQLDEHPLRRLGSYPIVFEEHEQMEEDEEEAAEQQVAAADVAAADMAAARADDDIIRPWPAPACTPVALAADGTWVVRSGGLARSSSGSSTRSSSIGRSSSFGSSDGGMRSGVTRSSALARLGSIRGSSGGGSPLGSYQSGSGGEATPVSVASGTPTSSDTPTSCGSNGSGNRRERRRRGGAKQRFLLRLVQAAGVRLAHQLLVAADADARRHGQV